MPAVSVVIPTFNRAHMVCQAVESVLAQDFTDYELIVVDDGSTDDTASVLEKHTPRIKIVRQSHRGVSAARNTGIDASHGRWIAFLDSDDLWLPRKLSVQFDFFQTHPEARICQTEEIWVRNGVRVNPKRRHRKPSGMIFERSLQLCLVSPSAVMMRRELFDTLGRFDQRLPACEDYDLWLRISCRYPIYRIDTPLIVKRGGHADQLSRAPGLDRYRIQSLTRLIRSQALSPEQAAVAVAMLVRKTAIYANGCRKRGRTQEADELARRVAAIERQFGGGVLPVS